jgi:hypothetical protein
MADTKQFPPRQTEPILRTVASITRKGQGPQSHAYDDADLSPLEFLRAVYRATNLPMSVRIQAASALLPYTHHGPRPTNSVSQCTYIIPYQGTFDRDPSPGPIVDETQSFPLSASSNLPAQSEGVAPVYIDENPDPSPPIDYSTPPTPAELQEIKAAINALRPDLAHLPVPEFHLCPCGHWITGEYDCCRRELSKLN